MRARLPEILAYLGLAGGLFLLLSWVGYGYRTTNGATFEQGRYLFPLMSLWGALIAIGLTGIGRRVGPVIARHRRAARGGARRRRGDDHDPALLLGMTVPSRILVTGGAGFVGANLCLALAAQGAEVVALDSLKRRGSELNLARLREAGVTFVHGDVRERGDLLGLEPVRGDRRVLGRAVGAGRDGQRARTSSCRRTCVGAHNCLELARRDGAQFVFLSTSRVYPVAALSAAAADRGRDALRARGRAAASRARPSTGSPRTSRSAGARTLYGATKLAAELLVAEYADAFGVRGVIDRCGVIAGPWQMGKVDQGVFTHWLLAHRLGRPLTYIGYGGTGKQVRDLLHVDDLCELILEQLGDPGALGRRDGQRRRRGRGQPVAARDDRAVPRADRQRGRRSSRSPSARPGDVPLYASDCRALFARTAWRPARGPRTILEDTLAWIEANEQRRDDGAGLMAATASPRRAAGSRSRAPPSGSRSPGCSSRPRR